MSELLLTQLDCGVQPVIAEIAQLDPYISQESLTPGTLSAMGVALSIMHEVPTHLWSFRQSGVRGKQTTLTRFATDPIPRDGPQNCAQVILEVDRSLGKSPLAKFGGAILGKNSRPVPFRAKWQIKLGNMLLEDFEKPDPEVRINCVQEESVTGLPSLVVPLIGITPVNAVVGSLVEAGRVNSGVIQQGTREAAIDAFYAQANMIADSLGIPSEYTGMAA